MLFACVLALLFVLKNTESSNNLAFKAKHCYEK